MGRCVNNSPDLLFFEPMCPGFAAPANVPIKLGSIVMMEQGQAQTFMVCTGCGSNQFHVSPVDFVCCSCGASHSD